MAIQASSLSIVIPALNEAECLPKLLEDLSRQQNIQLDIVVVDGGSTDQTVTICKNFASANLLPLKLYNTAAGRGLQMNEGTKHCAASDFLFLHADTRINDPLLLSNAQRAINDARGNHCHLHVAGHFPVKFIDVNTETSAYYFYECKTYLNRPDCINGDQGFWISKEYFDWLGQFDESLPYMEDAKLALKIFHTGKWITLPGYIETSARRFEKEGFTKRQILNSFLCNFNAMGVNFFFQSALDVYKTQDHTQKLELRPFLQLAHQQMNGDGITFALKRWYQTGAYIANNAWQLAFALDCRRNRKHAIEPGIHKPSSLQFYDRHLARFAQWPIVKALTGLLTIFWFYSLFLTR